MSAHMPVVHFTSMKIPIHFFKPAMLCVTVAVSLSALNADEWPEWRGPNSNQTSSETEFPLQWSEEKNVRWKVALPDRGNSSPIVMNGKVIITQAVEKENRRTTMAFDRQSGKLLWQQGVVYDKEETTHGQNPYCAASPATDGERIIVTYGSAGVYAYDLNGKTLWNRDLGPQVHVWGNASSPVIVDDICFLYHGPGPNATLYALNKETGKSIWTYEEPEANQAGRTDGFQGRENGIVGSFSTPLPITHNGRKELIMSFPNDLISFDPQTGKKLWWSGGMNPLVYTSAISGEGVAFGSGGYSGSSVAVRLGGNGNVSDSHRIWQNVRSGNSIGSGVIHNGHIYQIQNSGTAKCVELATGKTVWEEKIQGKGRRPASWSSMIRVGDHLYYLNQSSEMVVLAASPQFNLITTNPLDNAMCNSTQAMSNGDIFIRTWEHLWCIGEQKEVALK